MRERLPNRRESETLTLHDAAGRWFDVTFSRYPDTGRIGEVFFSSRGRSGTELDGLLFDAGVLASIAFQHGAAPRELAKSIARVEDETIPQSIIGRALDLLAEEGA